MNPIAEIGFKKTLKFVYYTLVLVLFDHALFPPIRTLILRLMGAKIGKSCVIHNARFFNLYYKGFKNLKIGDFCFIGNEVMLDMAGEVNLGNHVTLSNRAMILTHINVGYKNHPLQKIFPKSVKSVHFKSGSFIGAAAMILPGVTIGEKSAVGAGSLVRIDVANKTLVAGVPAKKIKRL